MAQSQIILLGVKHVCDFSKQIESSLNKLKPDIICVESDEEEFFHRVDTEKFPLWIKLYSKYQKIRAKMHGKPSGHEFKTAINYAAEYEIPYEIIDMNLDTILNETRKGPFNFFKHFLLHERNQFMTNKLKGIVRNYRTVVVLVGFVHLEGMSKILKSMDIPVRRKNLTKRDF